MLGDIREDQVGRYGGHLHHTHLAPFAFDVVFACKAKAPVSLQAGFGGVPGSSAGAAAAQNASINNAP